MFTRWRYKDKGTIDHCQDKLIGCEYLIKQRFYKLLEKNKKSEQKDLKVKKGQCIIKSKVKDSQSQIEIYSI